MVSLVSFTATTHRLGSNTPFFFKTSAKTGTVELTGLEMTRINALGQASAMDSARVAQIPALICSREWSLSSILRYHKCVNGGGRCETHVL